MITRRKYPLGVKRSRGGAQCQAQPGYITEKQALLNRLRRIEGQVRGLQRMVEDDTYCIDIPPQLKEPT